MRETDNMVRVKVVPIDVLYQSANFEHPVYNNIHTSIASCLNLLSFYKSKTDNIGDEEYSRSSSTNYKSCDRVSNEFGWNSG